MSRLTLTFGKLGGDTSTIMRASLRWLVPHGANCAAGQVLAYCNIGVSGVPKGASIPFPDEGRDLQMALVSPYAGRIRHRPGLARGGFHDIFVHRPWVNEPFAILDSTELQGDRTQAAPLMLVAGRRMTEAAEVRSGLLTGWHDRTRVSQVCDRSPGTLLAAVICDLHSALQGPSHAFIEFVWAASGAIQLVSQRDTVLVPSVRILHEQWLRTPEQMAAIEDDMMKALMTGPIPVGADDLLFVGALLQTMKRSPLKEAYTTVSRRGLHTSDGPDALLLSTHAEDALFFRHCRLGYSLAFHQYRLTDAGDAVRHWLRHHFDLVRRSTEQIKADYVSFLDDMRRWRPDMKCMVANALSTRGTDDLQTYSGQVEPMEVTLHSVRMRKRNLMLLQLARSHGIGVVDNDAIAAEMGAMVHLPDGLHGDGAIESRVRAEVIATAAGLGMQGFRAD